MSVGKRERIPKVSPSDPEPLDLDALRFEPLADRPSKVGLADLGRASPPGISLDDWLDGLPDLLGAGDQAPPRRDRPGALGRSSRAGGAGRARRQDGVRPYLIDWMGRGLLNGLALNGSAAIHDLELAIAGRTSEDVGPRLLEGTFGFARETSQLFAEACRRAAEGGMGLGAALGMVIEETGGPGLDSSLLVAARRLGIPLTVHVAIGTDIVHMTAELDGAALGKATLDDFRTLCSLVARLDRGVWLNLGSAVVLPEVFLKAVAIARNLGFPMDGLTTANLDFQQHYRGLFNVLQRPGAEGIALTGHHELLIPLLHAAVVARLGLAGGADEDRRLLPEPDRRHGDGHADLPGVAQGVPNRPHFRGHQAPRRPDA